MQALLGPLSTLRTLGAPTVLKKLLTAALAGAVAKLVLDTLHRNSAPETDQWADATDDVASAR